MKVGLLDYGAGNLHSLTKAIERFGATTSVSRDWDTVLAADALVLPGVGAFGAAVAALPEDRAPILDALKGGLPCLGICLGMQLLFESSEESLGDGIGYFEGNVRRLEAATVPHIGWNDVVFDGAGSPAADPGQASMVAYFANSYVCHPKRADVVSGWSTVDDVRFPSVVTDGAVWGVQFHPEKSSGPGLDLIARFLRMVRP